MDESYSFFATSALTDLSAEPAEPEVPINKTKKFNKKTKSRDESAIVSGKSEKETDLVAMISRKRDGAKRDIRLPSRYQESVLMEGNSWICDAQFGSENPVEKRPRKRLIDEQKRLLVLKKQPVADSSHVPSHANTDKRVIAVKRKRPQPVITPIPVVRAASPVKQKNVIPVVQKMTFAPQIPIRPLPLIPVPAPVMRKGTGTSEDLKQLYRELFYACAPARREHFQKKGIKPRINKPYTVNEAVRIIKALQLRERQLLYIKRLLGLWHHKLDLCTQVISGKARPEPNPNKDTETVVLSVLRAYQDSICYKLLASLPKLLNSNPASCPQPAAASDQQQQQVANGPDGNCPIAIGQFPVVVQSHGEKRLIPKSDHSFSNNRRSKKVRSQSLLIPKHQNSILHVPTIVLTNGTASPAVAVDNGSGDGQQIRGFVVNVASEAHDVLVNGKPQFKQFIWANNQQLPLPDQLIPKNGSDVVPRIMSSN
jgi:hypothetical protein